MNNNSSSRKNNQRKMGPMGGGPLQAPGEKPKDFKGTMKKLLKYLGKYKIAIFTVMIFAIASTVFSIFGPKILGKATTKLFEGLVGIITGTSTGIDFSYILNIVLILVAIYVLSMLCAYAQGLIMTDVSMKVTYRLRKDLSKKIHRLPFSYYDKTTHGEVLSHITNDVDTISQSLNQSITQIITSATTLIGILAMMLSISWQMTLITLLIIPLSVAFIMLIVKKSQKHFMNQQKYLGNVNGHIEEMYSSHTIVKAFNGEEKSVNEFSKYNKKLYESAWKSQFLSGLMHPVMNFIGNVGYVGVCIMGGYLAINGKISVGDIQAFVQYVRQFTMPISQVANISNILQQTVAASERVFNFLELPEEVDDDVKVVADIDGTSNEENAVKINGAVSFHNVKFGYLPDQTIIKDFTADIKPGQKVAIVGPTGAGKTTIVKLLMRFYDVNSGEIKLDGHNIKDFSREDLRRAFGMVLQDTWLYNASIKDNIEYGNLNATDEQIMAAAKAAQVDKFVKSLPDKYDMILDEESSNISQGQKQLLTIARAVLADPKVLILDEATSSVDTRTEILIQKAMDNLMKGRTSFVIAHRLSTIKDADLILVLKDGDIVEQGNHEELLAKDGFYSKLYKSQFEKSA